MPLSLTQRADLAFAPDVSMTFSRILRGWIPSTLADRPLALQVAGGKTVVLDLDRFLADAGALGLCVETIGEP